MYNSMCLHISFYYKEDRIKYLNVILNETSRYPFRVDIFIHTNVKDFKKENLIKYNQGSLIIVHHDLKDEHGHYLTWKCRPIMKQLRDKYDIFMYIEDDIAVPLKAIEYWMKYKDTCIQNNYNLGFIRIEHENGYQYCTDFDNDLYKQISRNYINIDGTRFIINDSNPYCAMWIYDQSEFIKWTESEFYDPANIMKRKIKRGLEKLIREKSAYGLHPKGHGCKCFWYKHTIIPTEMNGLRLNPDCRIQHLANNYIGTHMSQFQFHKIIKNN